MAADKHYEVFKLIFDNVEDKNPMTMHLSKDNGNYIFSPLHVAATSGNFDVCKLIIENVQDKNPSANLSESVTPLLMARAYGHHQIANYIKSKIEN